MLNHRCIIINLAKLVFSDYFFMDMHEACLDYNLESYKKVN